MISKKFKFIIESSLGTCDKEILFYNKVRTFDIPTLVEEIKN